MPQAYAYTRVSTVEQSQGMSLDGQLRSIETHAAQKGLSIVRSFVDRGVSGTAADRPAFQEMIEHLLAPSNKVKAVVVVHTSRFMRDVELARRYKRELKKRGVRVVAVQQETSEDENGELMEGIYELFDQHESRIIGARTKAAMLENARQGYFNGSLAPFGFQIERVKLGTKTTQKLALHPEEAKRDPDKKNPAGYTGPLLLGGFMRCGHCGKTLQLESSGKDSREYRYYQCRTFCRQGRGACPGYGSRKGSSTLPSSNIS